MRFSGARVAGFALAATASLFGGGCAFHGTSNTLTVAYIQSTTWVRTDPRAKRTS